ncbi:MAG: 3'-5' exonuclease, partial [Pirellulales bacterium]
KIMRHVLAESGYKQFLQDSEDEVEQERLANIEELVTDARQFDERYAGDAALEAFLEQASLVNDTDAWEVDDDRATLMTLHASKGLEFPVVFIVALEDGLLPHERCRNEENLLEEERRLLFVGITRAREELQLSLATNREFRGQRRRTVPSQFLLELPRTEMQVLGPAPVAASAGDETDEFGASDAHAQAAEDDVFDWEASSSEPLAAGPAAGRETMATTARAIAPLSTAAELERGKALDASRVSPEAFHQGMIVRHPSYGLGKIVALAGSGERRTATVVFATGGGEKNFVLAKSPLRPAKSG